MSVSAKLPSGNDYSLELDLAHQIIVDQCSHKVWPSKIEIKLKKQDGIRWNALEGSPREQNVPQPIPNGKLQILYTLYTLATKSIAFANTSDSKYQRFMCEQKEIILSVPNFPFHFCLTVSSQLSLDF